MSKLQSLSVAVVVLLIVVLVVGVTIALPRKRKGGGAPTTGKVSQETREHSQDRPSRVPPPELTVTTIASHEQLMEEWNKLKNDSQIAPYLTGRHRLLALTPAEEADKGGDDKDIAGDLNLYTALVFDYTNNRLINVLGRIGQLQPVEVREESSFAAPATDEEYEEAVSILMQNRKLAQAVADGKLELFPAMPGVFELAERTLAVGLKPRDSNDSTFPAGIAAVNLIKQGVMMRRHPATPAASVSEFISLADDSGSLWASDEMEAADPGDFALLHTGSVGCNPPPRLENSRDTGAISQSVTWGDWKFTVVRPKDSSPKRPNASGGGLELTSVYFRNKKVLHRAHVPILTAKHNASGANCGPYRDWQWDESQFSASFSGAGITNPNPAGTILETGSDGGNFNGVAIWQEWDNVYRAYRLVVASEMEAGWYRYVQKWKFYQTGMLKPEFGFGAVSNPCTCVDHTHHVYWRFDFDVAQASSNRVREYVGGPFPYWQDHTTEKRRYRERGGWHSYVITNALNAAEFVTLTASSADNQTNNFSATNKIYQNGFADGDVWFLSYKSNELHDGVLSVTGADAQVKPRISNWVNNESILNRDVVVWYGAHFNHDDEHGQTPNNHYVGPTIKTSW